MLTLEARVGVKERGLVIAMLAIGEVAAMPGDGYELALVAQHDDVPQPTRVWRIRFLRDGRWVRAGHSYLVQTPRAFWLNLQPFRDLRRRGDA